MTLTVESNVSAKSETAAKYLPEHVDMPEPVLRPDNWHHLPISVAVRDNPGTMEGYEQYTVAWNLMNSPHMLLSGTTGAGKSVALRTLAVAAIASCYDICLIDTQKLGGDFSGIKDFCVSEENIALSIEEAHELIGRLYETCRERSAWNVTNGVTAWCDLPASIRPRPILVMIDEAFNMMEKIPGGKLAEAENRMKQDIRLWIGKLASESRSAGIHLVLTVQRATVAYVDGNLKNNLSARLLLGPANADARKVGLLQPETAPELVGLVPKGRGIFEQSGKTEVVQMFYPGGTDEIVYSLKKVYQHAMEIAHRSDLVS